MAKFGFALIGFLVVVGGAFAAGMVLGGSWGTGMEADKQDQRLQALEICLELNDAAEMRACVVEATR